MRVLAISTDDQKIFEKDSAVAGRMVEYGKIFNELHIVIFSNRIHNLESRVRLSENVWAYPTHSKNKFLYIFDAFRIGRKIIQDSGFQLQDSVISTQDPFETGIIGLIIKFIYRLPLQIQIHTDFANKYFILHSPLNLIRFSISFLTVSFADSLRVVSDRIKNSVQKLNPNVLVLPIRTQLKEEKIEKKKDSEKIIFLTVTRLEKEKDLVTAIKAFKQVLDKNIDAQFTIVGDGSQKKNLESRVKNLGLEDIVKFVGWQNDLGKYYAEADIYVSSSLYEGYGMAMVEAGLSGLPLVLSDAGVAGSLFRNGEEAFVCRPKDIAGFARAMLQLANDSDLRHQMGEKAKTAAQSQNLKPDEYLRRFKEAMEQAVICHRAPGGIFKKNILARYLVAGFTGAGTQIGLLFIFTDLVGFWYLYSSLIAFVVAIIVSFTLQKFWTFADKNIDGMHNQFFKYLLVALFGIVFNTSFMFVLVDIFGLWYILAQIIVGAIIAALNFLMYKLFIFHK